MKSKKSLIFIVSLSIIAGLLAFSFLSNGHNIAAKDDDKTVAKESSLFVEMSQDELFGYADIVATGKVKKVSDPKEFKHNVGGEDKFIICKDYTFEVVEGFKGIRPSTEIIIRIPGGEIGKKVYSSDAAVPDLKQEQILFLKQYQGDNTQDVTYSILGGPQGKYVIEGNKAINLEKEKDLNAFKAELKSLKDKVGDKVILPPGFLN